MSQEWRGLANYSARVHYRVSAHVKRFVTLHIRPKVWPTVWVALADLAELQVPLRQADDLHRSRVPESWGWWDRPAYLIEVPRVLFGQVHNLLQREPDLGTYALVPDHAYTVFHVVHTPPAWRAGQPTRPSRWWQRLVDGVCDVEPAPVANANPGDAARPEKPLSTKED